MTKSNTCPDCQTKDRAIRRLAGVIGSACHLGADGKVRAMVIADSLRTSLLTQAANAVGPKET